jgi:hypothetical protein
MVIALTCAAGCCDTFCVNERAADADAHPKPMNTVDRFNSLSKRLPRKACRCLAQRVVDDECACCCCCCVVDERAADTMVDGQTAKPCMHPTRLLRLLPRRCRGRH